MIVNREATGGNQATSESTPVEAAAASRMSFSWEVMGVSCNLDNEGGTAVKRGGGAAWGC